MARQLTLKQAEFVREYVSNGGNGTQAALEAYDTEDEGIAASIASDNRRIPKIATAMQQALAALDIDETSIAVAARDALRATKAVAIGKNSDDSEPAVIEVADHGIRLNAAKFAAKLMDAYPMKQTLDGAKRIRQNIDMVANEPTEVLEWWAEHGRRPTRAERDQILGVKNPGEITVSDGENIPAKAASDSKHKAKRK